MAMKKEALTNLIADDLAKRNDNWAEIDTTFALKADKTYVDNQDATLTAQLAETENKIDDNILIRDIITIGSALNGTALPAGSTRFTVSQTIPEDGFIPSIDFYVKKIGTGKLKLLRKSNNLKWYLVDEVVVNPSVLAINTINADSAFLGFYAKKGDVIAWFGDTAEIAYSIGSTTHYMWGEHLPRLGDTYALTGGITLAIAYTINTIPSLKTDYKVAENVFAGDNKNYRVIAGTLRSDTLLPLKWRFLDDSTHAPSGFEKVEASVVDGLVWLYYNFTSKKIVSLTITPHRSALDNGFIHAGGSVGLSSAAITLTRLLSVQGKVDGLNVTLQDNQILNMTNEVTEPIAGTIRVSSLQSGQNVFKAENLPVVSPCGGYYPEITNVTSMYFDVRFRDYSGNLITEIDDNCKFMFSRQGYNKVHPVNDFIPSGITFWVYGIMEV